MTSTPCVLLLRPARRRVAASGSRATQRAYGARAQTRVSSTPSLGLHASAVLFQAVKFAGVPFLLWMAWATLRESGALAAPAGVAERGLRRIATRAVLINLLNPKLAIFFAAFLPQFVQPGPGATTQMAVLGLVFTALTAAVFAVYGLFAASARDWILTSERAMAWMRRAFAACFAGLGLRLAFAER